MTAVGKEDAAVEELIKSHTAKQLAAMWSRHRQGAMWVIPYLFCLVVSGYAQVKLAFRAVDAIWLTRDFRSFLGAEFRDWLVSVAVMVTIAALGTLNSRRRLKTRDLIDRAIKVQRHREGCGADLH